ncbi:rhomboid family intramembrane serine protease [Halobacteria archaeon AArc-m2/3/4]|uniref:Rhomboid family intramembrane serine protease n=1 Tax=Natronoglomus mannanivorans TaxID=2979990 RepID=A0ABT2Q8Q3_9EURY|nr:rhomboid family intramembrane serine protease [Halobacteria archaeon AArc-m2/3/4]
MEVRVLSAVLVGLVAVTVVTSIGAVRLLDRSDRRWSAVLQARLVMGVPWGTLVVICFVLSIYLFVQDGITAWHRPVVIPYRAWSYFYPLGMLTAPFSHASEGHLVGNLVGALAVAPIAEYAWGHYPRDRGSASFSSWRRNPWIRALVIFPLVVIGVGLVTSLFALGPVIGFSGVVYAFAGFAIVRYPIATLIAVTSAQGALMTVYRAINQPIYVTTAQASPPSAPGWATIAIQGHALGFLLGFCCAVVLFQRRGVRSDPVRLWVALVLFGFAKSLWAIYWFRGSETYVLYRGLGVVVVTTLAILATLAVVSSDRPLFPSSTGGRPASQQTSKSTWRPLELGLPSIRSDESPDDSSSASHSDARSRSGFDTDIDTESSTRIRELVGDPGGRLESAPTAERSTNDGTIGSALSSITRRELAFVAIVVVLALISGPALPFNIFVLEDDSSPGEESITVEGYSITYAEDVENELISFIDISMFGEDTAVETSGVIVSNPDRNIWDDAVSANRLAFSGQSTVHVGGPGWRESVTAFRQGWSATGGETAYQIWLQQSGESAQHVFTSEPAQTNVQLAGNNVTVVPDSGAFYLVVENVDSGAEESVRIPMDDGTVEAGGVTFEREGSRIYGEVDDTRVQVANRERYNR